MLYPISAVNPIELPHHLDGKGDLVWRNTATGAVAVWLMDGPTIVDARVVAGVPLVWEIQ